MPYVSRGGFKLEKHYMYLTLIWQINGIDINHQWVALLMFHCKMVQISLCIGCGDESVSVVITF